MRKIGLLGVVAVLLALVVAAGCAQPAAAPTMKPTVVLTPSVVALDGASQIVIMGSDYQPGQEIKIIIRDPQVGSLVNLATQTDPAPVVNDQGAWATTWTLGRYASRGVFTEGLYRLWVTDANGQVLASAPFGVADTSKPQDQWPSWAKALIVVKK